MTGQFDATRPVSRHHPPAESSATIWVASSTAEWATYGRNWNHISNYVGLSTWVYSRANVILKSGGEASLSRWPSSPPRFERGAADWVLLRREMEALPPRPQCRSSNPHPANSSSCPRTSASNFGFAEEVVHNRLLASAWEIGPVPWADGTRNLFIENKPRKISGRSVHTRSGY
jgi:hypothetical protein